jgi:hypothetical protein
MRGRKQEHMVVSIERVDQRKAVGSRIRSGGFAATCPGEVARVDHAGIAVNYETGKRDLPPRHSSGVEGARGWGGYPLETTEVVVVRDTRLSRAVERLVRHPELAEIVAPSDALIDDAAS